MRSGVAGTSHPVTRNAHWRRYQRCLGPTRLRSIQLQPKDISTVPNSGRSALDFGSNFVGWRASSDFQPECGIIFLGPSLGAVPHFATLPLAPDLQVEQTNRRERDQRGEEPRPFRTLSTLELTVEVGVRCRSCCALGSHLPFAFSPSSTRRRMASGRPGRSSCFRRQSSRSFAMSGCTRTITGSPVTAARFRGFVIS
jgi:hypothetical protein